jgi:predicted DNA-binding protein (UPF0251 family)
MFIKFNFKESLMPRPQKRRNIGKPPHAWSFKPVGIPASELETEIMTVDEYEAIRLADYEKMDHLEASEKMGISRPTFSRLIEKARNKVSIALVEGKAIRIQGGNIDFEHTFYQCLRCGRVYKRCSLENGEEAYCPGCGSPEFREMNTLLGGRRRRHCHRGGHCGRKG